MYLHIKSNYKNKKVPNFQLYLEIFKSRSQSGARVFKVIEETFSRQFINYRTLKESEKIFARPFINDWRTSQTPNIFHVKRPWREGIDNRNFIPPHLPLRSPLINNLADGKVEVTLGTKIPRCEQAYCSELLMLQNISSSCVKVWHPNESSTKSSIQIRVVRTR